MTNKLYKLMNWPKIEEIIYSESDNPHALLGPHRVGSQTLVQAFFPEAQKAAIVFDETRETVQMELADEDGFFAALIPLKELPRYHYVVKDKEGVTGPREEAYRNTPLITKRDTQQFKNGIYYTVYDKLGAHPMALDGVQGTYFAVWAPNALRVSVVGDFNGWDGRIHQMRRLWDSGIFEIFVPGAAEGDNYKFELKLRNGMTYLKADPYANAAQLRPETASVVADIYGFVWEDEAFVSGRAGFQCGNAPVSVYELYLGSFVEREMGKPLANYREIADRLIPYMKEMCFTHVELMPVMEYPQDATWGYQTLGYYAPTARYGAPADFMYLVNELHKAGIGVILDWVPGHFPRDEQGLAGFDGTCLYEHLDPRQGYNPRFGTGVYHYGRPEVSNYLIASALFWVEKYHVDGIRVDDVEGMLYLDYGRGEGEWIPNIYGGNENLEAIELLKHLNSIMKKRNPGVLMIAEERSAFPQVTGKLKAGGLGFDLKWNTGLENDYLNYIRFDPVFRSYHHGELTFSMIYAYSEKFMLAFPHDELSNGKGSLLGKMPGERAQKLANLRLTLAYMMCHPGRKLLFMGQELGEPEEWNEERSVEWELREAPEHEGVRKMVADLNRLYRENPQLHARDDVPAGFEWVNEIASDACYLSFLRKGEKKDEVFLVVANFAGVPNEITTGVPFAGKYKEIFNSDDGSYGGTGLVNRRVRISKAVGADERANSVTVRLAALSLSVFRYIPVAK